VVGEPLNSFFIVLEGSLKSIDKRLLDDWFRSGSLLIELRGRNIKFFPYGDQCVFEIYAVTLHDKIECAAGSASGKAFPASIAQIGPERWFFVSVERA